MDCISSSKPLTAEQQEKVARIHNLYKAVMYSVAFKILKNDPDAEDAVNQAFLKISENIDKISEIDCPKTKAFVVIIVKNVSIDIYNKNKKTIFNSASEENLQFVAVKDDILDSIDYKELIKRIKNLPSGMKDALYLNCVIGYSVQETASILNISVEAAYKRIERAKAILAKKI
ncbi:MAG: sigma-70 family RNA polymerase sigma factor [Clostridiales bacterium]|nr:sigma-70 family RNA polymerase sigma factor [Clostridiales bacterium]